MTENIFSENFNKFIQSGLGTPILLIMILAMVILPLPPFLLDLLFTFNILLALIVLLVSVYSERPLDFQAFPTVLLIATLLRLSLNVASTRVVLLEGHQGGDAAGKVIQAFGEVVIGGNYAVGLVVFVILVIINFVVVTKGAGRIAEVSARFTLDAMPGKQMAIDADLNAGLINQAQAKMRREDIAREADFYGSMDGASKFVRGDAVAGILITVINIIGGFAVGMIQHDLPASQAAQFYTLLTIGDGLVAQIPSLVLSTAAGIMVTRDSGTQDMGKQMIGQLFGDTRILITTASIMGLLGVIPGMPHVAFLLAAALIGGMAWRQIRNSEQVHDGSGQVTTAGQPGLAVPEGGTSGELAAPEQADEVKELSWDDVATVDVIGLEVGFRLISMVAVDRGGQLMGRIKGVRKKLSQDLGFLIPPVHIRDNLDLSPNTYQISLMGVMLGEAEIYPDRELAINPGQVFGTLEGIKTVDPAFSLEAIWIEASQKDYAQSLGYTVVDANTVVATHLSQLLQDNAQQLLGHEEAQQLLDRLATISPKLAEDLVPQILPLGTVVKVLQNLLIEGIPIRDIKTIAEVLVDYGKQTQDANILTGFVRIALGRLIVQHINGTEKELPVITLDPSLEQILHQSIQAGAEGSAAIEPGLAERLLHSLQETVQQQEMNEQSSVLLVAASIRMLLVRFVKYALPNLSVLAYEEIPDNIQIRIVATVGQ